MAPVEVWYDGQCPVCRMEVGWYGRMDRVGAIAWHDITALPDHALPAGKTRDDLLNRFHVRDTQGRWHVGVDAFARIWRELPFLRHAAFLFRVPGLRQMAGAGYRLFLAWQRSHRRRRAGNRP
ncbi:MAG: DUF393 domain-containing protein [Phyllobacteriaceae bacterium]|nr:DUF393 domain-containing protein [Phyllobacteriaceae bacterium]MBA91977.1 DUF393 domain-containing protein [Phyllobacteriaceae bacterium]